MSLSGTHTNNIESRWHALKKSLPKHRTQKTLYSSYFAEYCTRRKFVDAAPDKFLKILQLVGSVYNPNRARELAEQELLPQQQNTTAAAATAATELPQASVNTDFAIFPPTDVANFDLGFEMSDDNDSDVDMFL